MSVSAVTDSSFQADVLESDIPVMVDFWAAWCGPCRQIAPIVEEIAEEYEGRLKVVKMDTEANSQTPRAYGIISIPTLNIYAGGSLVKSIVGARPKKALTTLIDEAIGTQVNTSNGMNDAAV